MKIIRPITVLDAILTSTNVTEADYAAYNPATTYALGDRVIVVSTDVHKIYESLQASNTGNTPASSPTWWLDVGSTNRWKMFDLSIQSQTTNTDSIEVELTITGRADSIALLNVDATEIQITSTDATDGVVFDETYSMVSVEGITDWYSYFFEEIEYLTELVVTGMPAYPDPVIDVFVNKTGSTAACGACVVGFSKEIGFTQYGANLGIQDYSIKQQDAFGNYSILERAYNNRGSFVLFVEAGNVDKLHRLLAGYRATPIVYVGSDDYVRSVIYGFYRDFSISIQYADFSVCNLELEGLT